MLENKRIGFIGSGMMAEAIARGLLNSGVAPSRVTAADPDEGRRNLFSSVLGVAVTTDNTAVARNSDIIVLAVKPYVIGYALSEIGSALTAAKLVISIVAGVPTDFIQGKLAGDIPVVRVMPNTPCLIGQGAIALAPGKYATADHMKLANEIFAAVGSAVQVTEDKLDAVTGLSGSGPAYVYTFIEALADGGVRMGLPKATALLLAAQTAKGAAMMVLESDSSPADLRDRVTTPGGTTIEGSASLERDGFRSALIEAVKAASDRSSELGKSK